MVKEYLPTYLPTFLVLVSRGGTKGKDYVFQFFYITDPLFHLSLGKVHAFEIVFDSLPLSCSWPFLLFPSGVRLSATLVILFVGHEGIHFETH